MGHGGLDILDSRIGSILAGGRVVIVEIWRTILAVSDVTVL
jgi:hypothetical protein